MSTEADPNIKLKSDWKLLAAIKVVGVGGVEEGLNYRLCFKCELKLFDLCGEKRLELLSLAFNLFFSLCVCPTALKTANQIAR